MTRGQLMEFWHGLVNSGKPFLWVKRHDNIVGAEGESVIQMELLEGTIEKGFFCGMGSTRICLGPPSSGWVFNSQWLELHPRGHSRWGPYDLLALDWGPTD
jgi:hypothetical protein